MKPEDMMKFRDALIEEAFIRTMSNIDPSILGSYPYNLIKASIDSDEATVSSNILDFQTCKSIIEGRRNNGKEKV